MPLFFILSGMTYNWSENYSDFISSNKKSAKHLLEPALILYALTGVIILVQKLPEINSLKDLKFFLQGQILRVIFASGNPVVYGKEEIPGIGMAWFLVALFFSREIHDFIYLNKKIYYWVTLLSLWLFGVIISRVQFLPLCLDVCFTALPLYAVSLSYRKTISEESSLFRIIISGVGWGALFFITRKFGFFSFAGRHYPL